MSRIREFALPDLGEGLTEGEILQWLVTPGETVRLNQPVVEVETAKAAVEIPSPYAGVVTEVLFDAGATVDVGSTIIRFDTDPAAGPLEAAAAQQAAGAAANPAESATRAVDEALSGPPYVDDLIPPAAVREPEPKREAVLVGYGVRQGAARRRPRRVGAPAGSVTASVPPADGSTPPPARVSGAAVAQAAQLHAVPSEAVPAVAAPPSAAPPPGSVADGGRVHVLAKPPVRQLAKTLGVDLAAVPGTGPGGTVSRADVEAAAAGPAAEPAAAVVPISAATRADRRVPIKGVRKATAAAMVASAFTAPHVTLFMTVDVTESMALVGRLRRLPDFEGVKVTPLLLVARALLLACRRNPEVNASWDEARQEIVLHGAVNLGIAAATPRGLLVPNIKDADLLGLVDLARALQQLTATAREGRTTPADMARGTITITNVGTFGVDNGTPILNPGEAAILCFGAVREQPWMHEGAVAVRSVTQLTLSFDHRLVDGQLGARVLADVGNALADPTRLLAWA